MATKYWRNLTPFTWSSTACWSNDSPSGTAGAAIPVIGDDVVISNVGQAAGTINITATATAKLNSWTVIGGTWTVAGTQQVNIAGTFDCQNVTWTNTGVLSLQGTGASYDITASGTTFGCAVTLNAFIVASSSFNLLSAFTTGATQTTTLTAGTLILNNFTWTTGIFNTNATNTREIQFGTGNIALIHTTAATTVLVLSNYTNFSCSGTGGFTSAMSTTRTFNVGSTGASNSITVNLALTSGASVPTFTASGWFNHLNFTGSSVTVATLTVNVNSLTLASGGTYTALTVNAVGTGTITPAGKSLAAFTVNHTGTTTLSAALGTLVTGTTTLTLGTLDLAGFTLTTGTFSSSQSNTRAIAFGAGNIVLSHTTLATTVLSMAIATGFTWTGTGGFTVAAMSNTRTFTFGTTGGTTSNAPNLTFTTGASVATITTAGWFNKLDYGTTSFNPGTTTLNLNALTLSSSGTYTTLTAAMRGTGTITSNGKSTGPLVINNGVGTTTLAAALSCTTYTQTAGTIDFATFNLTCSSTAAYTAGTLSNIGTITCTTWTVTGTFTLTQGTITPSTSFVLTSGAFNYNGGTLSAVPTFTHTAGTVTLGQSYALTTTGTYTQTAGVLTLAGFTLTTGIFSSSNANTRDIAFGTGNIALSHTTAATTVLSMATTTGFTWTGTGGFTVADMAVTRTFTCGSTAGGTTSNAPNLTFTTGAQVATITTASWFNKLDYGTTSFTQAASALNLNALTLSSTGTYTALILSIRGTGTLTYNGKTTAALTINSAGTTTVAVSGINCTTFTRTAGTIDFATFSLTCTNSLTGDTNLFALAGTVNLNTITCPTYTVNGTVTMTSGQSLTATTSFVTATAFIFNGGTLTTPLFTHTSGTVTLGANLSPGVTGTYTLTAGTLNLAGFTLTTGIFSSSNANTRDIAFGTGNIALSHTTAVTTVLSMATLTGFTYTGTGGFTVADMAVTRTFTCGSTAGGSSNIAPNLTFTSGAQVATLTTASWFNKLDYGTTSFTQVASTLNVNSITLSSGGTYTALTATMVGTGTITSNGKTLAAFTVNHTGTTTLADAFSVGVTSTTTLTQGTLDLAGFNLTTGIFSSSNSNTRAIAFGTNNIVLSHTTAATTVLSMATLTAFTYTGTGGFTVADMAATRTFTFGSTAGGTTSNAPNLTFTTGAQVATITTQSWFNTLDFGTTSFNPGTTTLNLNSLTLSSSGTYTTLTAAMRGTGTITSNGKSTGPLVINNGAGTTTLAAAALCTTFTMTAGTINFVTFTLTCSAGASYTAGTLSNIGTITCTTWTVTGTFTLTQGTITPSTSFVLTSGAFNYNGGTLSAVPTFTHTAGTVTLGQSYALTTTGTYTQTAGVLTLTRGSTLATGIFSSSGSGTRSISFGSSISSTTGSLYFSGTTFTTTTNSAFSMGTEDFTVEGWAWMDSSSDALAGIICSVSGSSSGFGIARDYGGGMLNANGSGGVGIGWLSPLSTSTWFHFALTMQSNTLRLFKDGVLQGTTTNTYSGLPIQNSSNIVSLATRYAGGSSWPFAGYFSNIRIVRGVAVYTAAFTPPELQLSSTQLANTNGNPSAAITGTQTTLLLNTVYGSAYLTDSSTYNSTTTSGSLPTSNKISPYLSDINLTHTTTATVVLSMATATNFTWTGAGGFTVAAMSNTRTFTFGSTAGGTTTNAPNLTFTTGASVATITTAGWFNKLDYGSTSFTQAVSTLNLNALTLSSSGTYTSLTATTVGTGTITTNGKTIAALTINSAGTTTLADALSVGVTGTTTLTQGTLDLGGFNLTTGIFSSTNANTRAIAFGTGNIVLSHTTAATVVLSMDTTTGFTYTGTGGFTVAAMSNTRTFTFGSTAGGTTTNAPNLTFTTGASVATITTAGWFNTLNFGTTSFNPGTTTLNLNALTLSSSGTYTSLTATTVGTGTITTNGKTIAALIINSAGTTTLADAVSVGVTGTTTLTQGTLDINGFILTTGIFSSTNTNTRSIVFGTGNIALSHTTDATTVLSMDTTTGFTYTGTGGFTVADMAVTRTFTCGSTAGGTTSNAPNLAFTTGASVATLTTASWFNTLDFGTTSFNPGTTTLNLNALTLSSSGTYTTLTAAMRGTGTITNNGKTIAALTINSAGTTTLAAALTMSGALTLTQGTLACSIYILQSATFASTGTATRSMTGSGTYTITGSGATFIPAFSNASAAGITITGLFINMNSVSAKTFAGGGGSYGILLCYPNIGTLSITGSNSFADIQVPSGLIYIEYLVVAGGGAGGTGYGGGGGGGGYLTATGLGVAPSSVITVTVGAGGTGSASPTAGDNSQLSNGIFANVTAIGGGVGQYSTNSSNGGSGGGATLYSGSIPGTGTVGQGTNGGTSGRYSTVSFGSGGGGGGAGAGGYAGSGDGIGTVASTGDGTTGGNKGNGGAGLYSSITGSSVAYAGGGGGGTWIGYVPGPPYYSHAGDGGVGGGGNGAYVDSGMTAGTVNTGGGGGGASAAGASGGSGVVIIRYADTYAAATSTTGSPTITVAGGYRVYQWTSSGTITF